MKIDTNKLPFSRVDQIGVIVRDIDKAVAHYESLGIGPFMPLKGTPKDRKMYGQPAPGFQNKFRVAQIGAIELELIQPVSGDSPQRRFLETKGEGVHHIAVFVDDIDQAMAEMVKKGYEAVLSWRFVEGGGGAYFDTDKIGGIMTELLQLPK